MHQGVICVEKIAAVKGVHLMDVRNIPGCTYCMPQVASVGLTEQAAKDKGYQVKVGKSSSSPATARPSPWANRRA